jgi:regulator of cell morphogenesis and NO signaling
MEHLHAADSLLQTPLKSIVVADPRTAVVFDRLGLDYCCHGQQSLQDAVLDRGIPVSDVVDALHALGAPPAAASGPETWTDIARLVEHIVTQHHAYVRQVQPAIAAWLDKLVSRHGSRHPELLDTRQIFDALSTELLVHMRKEEDVLFPYMEALEQAQASRQTFGPPPFRTVQNPIAAMEHDHEEAGALLERLRASCHDYQPPADGCTTYRLCYMELERFEADLHRHVHLENNLLFPRAIAIEDAMV